MNDDVEGDEDQGALMQSPDASHVESLKRWAESVNIAIEDDLDDNKLDEIGMLVSREYEIDHTSLADWRQKVEKAEKIANQIAEEKQYPWPKASNVLYPLITVAALQFAARAYPAVVNGRNVVKGSVIGRDDGQPLMNPQTGQPVVDPNTGGPAWVVPPGAKQSRADRIGEHMSYQLLDEQEEWEPETDKLLHVLPIIGTAFRKVFFDPDKGRNSSIYVSALDLVVNYSARSLERAPRITEEIQFYPLEISEKERAGIFREIDYGTTANTDGDIDAPITFLEQHRWLDLDDDGVKEPYIVTICKENSKVARIVARYDLDGIHYNQTRGRIHKIEPIHYYELYQFLPNFELKGSIYGTGFGSLLLPLNESINTTLNMLIDAGHLANTQGGFIGKGLSMSAGTMKFQPGEYKMVNAQGGTIKDNIVQLQFPGPSTVLFQLLTLLIDAGREISAVKDVLTGENQSANTPATTTLAMIEQGLKVFTSIYKRIYRSLKGEYRKLYRLNSIYLEQETSYRVGDDWKTITRQDYEAGSGVEPVSDPSQVSDMQKLGKAGFLMQFAGDPECNSREIKTRIFKAAGIENIEKVFNQNPQPNPALLAKLSELEAKHREVNASAELKHAQSILARAQAINQFAQADKAVGDLHIAFIEQELAKIQMMMEAASSMQEGGGKAAPAPVIPGVPGGAGHAPAHVALPAQAAPPAGMPQSPQAFLAAARGGDIPG